MNVTDNRQRIAVFIDFDNVEIGVKSTIGGQFDIGVVLEAIKERGEIVTKVAYSDWKRAGDYSRLLTQHAIRMVQRNLTPGGDKNGADITMALDALEMAFTHDHINAFVIVGGDSDFISLVEKLKQYGRRVIVVGGRQFTSLTMQRNCHEFIAYENLVGSTPRARQAERAGVKPPAGTQSDISKVLPLVRRALKVLSEREVTPQLGLLKSTLLQLDSTFSEREYGANSFRDFMEKVAKAGAVSLKQAGRSMLVEPIEDDGGPVAEVGEPTPPQRDRKDAVAQPPRSGVASMPDEEEEELPTSPLGNAEGVRVVQRVFSSGAPRWPMYIRQAKQYLKNAVEGFDERKYGFASVVDLLRAAAKVGVLRIERDRQGGMRVFPGANLKSVTEQPVADVSDVTEAVVEASPELTEEPPTDVAAEPPILDAVIADVESMRAIPLDNVETGEMVVPQEGVAGTDAAVETPRRGAKRPRARSPKEQGPTRSARKTAAKPAKEPRAKASRPRGRKSSRAKGAEAADTGVHGN
jgi:uncharacterized protein (TIGR00288 family)